MSKSLKFDPVEDFSMIEAGSLLVAKVIGYLWTAALFLKVKVFRKEIGLNLSFKLFECMSC